MSAVFRHRASILKAGGRRRDRCLATDARAQMHFIGAAEDIGRRPRHLYKLVRHPRMLRPLPGKDERHFPPRLDQLIHGALALSSACRNSKARRETAFRIHRMAPGYSSPEANGGRQIFAAARAWHGRERTARSPLAARISGAGWLKSAGNSSRDGYGAVQSPLSPRPTGRDAVERGFMPVCKK